MRRVIIEHICDRCGKKEVEDLLNATLPRSLKLPDGWLSLHTLPAGGSTKDLCPDCAKRFEEFMFLRQSGKGKGEG